MRLIAGPNGSGKTTLTKLLREEFAVPLGQYLNPDDIARHISIPDECGNELVSNDSAAVLAQKISIGLREDWLRDGLSFTYESVMSHESHIRFIEHAIKQDYKPYLYYVCVSDVDLNKERVAQRVQEGGHDVPIEKIASRYERSLVNLYEMLCVCRRGFLFDNSTSDMILIAEMTMDGFLDIKADAYEKTQPYWFKDAVLSKWNAAKIRLIR